MNNRFDRLIRKVRRRLTRQRLEGMALGGPPSVEVHHPRGPVQRRAGDFGVNVCGIASGQDLKLRYTLNGGPWRDARQEKPRTPPPRFTLELPARDLNDGVNQVRIEGRDAGGRISEVFHEFEYLSGEITFPVHRTWENPELDVVDGVWETAASGSERVARPVAGHEDYDRLLVVTGAFAGGRRVETTLTLREIMAVGKQHGFGLLPLWGGHPDEEAPSPGRGWRFSLGWYYTHYGSVGMEFSTKEGAAKYDFLAIYRSWQPERDRPYRVVMEAWPEKDASGAHARWQQRMKWWDAAESEPEHWMELSDETVPLPDLEYGVALIASRCHVEFGPVRVTALSAD